MPAAELVPSVSAGFRWAPAASILPLRWKAGLPSCPLLPVMPEFVSQAHFSLTYNNIKPRSIR